MVASERQIIHQEHLPYRRSRYVGKVVKEIWWWCVNTYKMRLHMMFPLKFSFCPSRFVLTFPLSLPNAWIGFIGSHTWPFSSVRSTLNTTSSSTISSTSTDPAYVENLCEIQDLPNFKFAKGRHLQKWSRHLRLEGEQHRPTQSLCILQLRPTLITLSVTHSHSPSQANIYEYGTHVLLECGKNCPTLKRFIHVSTDERGTWRGRGKLLMPSLWIWTKSRFWSLTTPSYAATKAGAEFLVKSYQHRSFKLPWLHYYKIKEQYLWSSSIPREVDSQVY